MLNENVVKVLKGGMWDLATCRDGEPNVAATAKGALIITPEKVIVTTPGADNKKEL